MVECVCVWLDQEFLVALSSHASRGLVRAARGSTSQFIGSSGSLGHILQTQYAAVYDPLLPKASQADVAVKTTLCLCPYLQRTLKSSLCDYSCVRPSVNEIRLCH